TSDVGIVGDDNNVDVLQDNRLTAYVGTENVSTVDILGSSNDVDVDQTTDNTSDVDILGVRNDVEVTQLGTNDSDVDILGYRNLVSVTQEGNHSSTVSIDGFLSGDDNTVTVSQGNILSSVFGQSNDSLVDIYGDDNTVTVTQDGGNTSTVTISGSWLSGGGDGNVLNIDQSGANTLTASIYGDNNNASGAFGGDAAFAAAGSLNPGDMFQAGRGNSISLTVGSASESDGNLFAFSQSGSGNTIEGSISGGNYNQAVVTQVGANNLTNFVQVGSFNNLGVVQ
ncbi:MAG: hypothetical protein ACU0B8_06655, partial [Pseudooceanicola nanhaiensis]